MLLAFFVLEICVLRKRRRERALRRAAREAERGSRCGGSVSQEMLGGDDYAVEKDEVEVMEEEKEAETGRKGMSLPRRMW